MPTQISVRLSDIRTSLELAHVVLADAAFFPGVEALVVIPLKLIEYCEIVSNNKEELDQLAATLELLQRAIFEPIEVAQGHQYVPELAQRLQTLSEALVEMEKNLAQFASLGHWGSFRRREDVSATLKSVNEGINRAIRLFQLGGQISVETKTWDAAAERSLATLHPARARFDASEKQPCLPNTRSTLLATLRDHVHTSPRTFICLYGSPGTGKSAIAKTIATELHHDGLLAASYFFDKRGGDAGNISLATFISTLVYQLARYNYDFWAALCRQLERDPLLADATADVRLRELLLEPLRQVFAIRKLRQRWIIVLDALDECGDASHQRRLMSLLRSCAGLGEGIVFFLTCRPEAAITQVVQGWPLGPRAIVESMDSQDAAGTTEDIRAFIDSRMLELKALEGWAFSPSSEDISRLAVLCGGLFEVAAIRVRQLNLHCRSTPLRRAFAHVLRAAEGSLSVSSPLQRVYSGIMNAAYASPDDPERRAEMLASHHTLVGVLTVLRQPLAITALADLVGLEVDEAVKALEPLSSVIAVRGNEPVHFYHASFLEFLLSPPVLGPDHRTLEPEYLISPLRAHTALASRTLTLMNQFLRRNILDLPNPFVANSAIPDLSQTLALRVPPHLRYACLYWSEHLQPDGISTYSDLLVQWCNEKLIFYLEVLGLLDEIERAVPHMKCAEDCIRQTEILAPTATLLNDCQRLVQMFSRAITHSVGSVYSSAIPLMPSCQLHQQYSPLVDVGPQLVRGRLSAWPAQIWAAEHPAGVSCVALSPGGRHIASGCYDGLIRLCSATTGRIEQLLQGHTELVLSVAFSPDGQLIVSGSNDWSVRLWSAATGEQERILEGHTLPVNSVAFSTDGASIASGSDDGLVCVWSVAGGEQKQVLEGHTDWVRSVAFSQNGSRIISASADCSVRIWSAVTGEQERVLEGHTGYVNSVAFSPDGAYVVSGSDDTSVRIWCTATGEQERVLEGNTSPVKSIAFSADGARIVSGSDDRLIRVWSTATGEQERVLKGHNELVNSVMFSADGSRIISGSDDCSVRVWSTAIGEQERLLTGHTYPVNSVAFSSNGARIVSGSDDRSVRVWFTATGEQERVLKGHSHPVNLVSFSLDDETIKSTNERDITLLWNTTTGLRLNQGAPFESGENAVRMQLENGWLHVNGLSVWVPHYMQGSWWATHNMVVLASDDNRGMLAFLRLPS